MMMKLVSLILLGALALGLSGCSGSDSSSTPKAPTEAPKNLPGGPDDKV